MNLHIYGKASFLLQHQTICNVKIVVQLDVNGAKQHPLYEKLKADCPPTINEIGKRAELIYDPIRANDISWNFGKFSKRKRIHSNRRLHTQT